MCVCAAFGLVGRRADLLPLQFFFYFFISYFFSIIVIIAVVVVVVIIRYYHYYLLYFGRTCSRHVIHSLMERNDTHYIPAGRSRCSIVSSPSLGHSDTRDDFFFFFLFFLLVLNSSSPLYSIFDSTTAYATVAQSLARERFANFFFCHPRISSKPFFRFRRRYVRRTMCNVSCAYTTIYRTPTRTTHILVPTSYKTCIIVCAYGVLSVTVR